MTQDFIDRIDKNAPTVSTAIYTKNSLKTMCNDILTHKKMTKEQYLSYCVGYIHNSVITENMNGKKHFLHDYEISYFIYHSAEEFNDSLLEKLQVMFPDATIIIKNRKWFNLCASKPIYYLLYISW